MFFLWKKKPQQHPTSKKDQAPQTLDAFIAQAKDFLGIDVMAVPHWRAAPSSPWGNIPGTAYYTKNLERIKTEGSGLLAFVTHSSKGAYIVYADHGRKWDGMLRSNDEQADPKVHIMCHELTHLLVEPDPCQLSPEEYTYFNEQCAVLGSSMLKATVGRPGLLLQDSFPCIKAFQTDVYQDIMPYDAFSVYTFSPYARYLCTKQGHEEAAERYLTSNGDVRFDLVSGDLAKSVLHLRYHLTAMELFGGIALDLVKDQSLLDYVTHQIPDFDRNKHWLHAERPDRYVQGVLMLWWGAAQEALGDRAGVMSNNIYAGISEPVLSRPHVDSYYLNLAAAAQNALVQRPDDCLLPLVCSGLTKMLERPGFLPRLRASISRQVVDVG